MTFPNFTSQFNEISLNISYSSYLNYRCLTRLTRQILPVVKNGTQANIVDASLKKSHLWQHVHQQVIHLQRNLRAHLTDYCRYPATQTGPQTWLPYHRSQIPAPTKHHQRYSHVASLPARQLSSRSSSSTALPPANMPSFHALILSPSDLPFQFKRLQFPIRLCYAMTINKAQGQTFKTVGLDLTTPVFSDGMIYVALSRVGTACRRLTHPHVRQQDKKHCPTGPVTLRYIN